MQIVGFPMWRLNYDVEISYHFNQVVREALVAERLTALFLTHSIFSLVSGVGSSPALATFETSQVLLAGVSGCFSRGSPVFTYLLIDPSHMS